MKSMLCLGIAVGLIAAAMFPKPSMTHHHLTSAIALIDGADCLGSVLEPECCAGETDNVAAADVASPERVNLRCMATFESFHNLQEHEFATIPLKFGNMRMTEMQYAKNLSHTASSQPAIFRLRESTFGAVLTQFESRSTAEDGHPTPEGPLPFPNAEHLISLAAFDAEPCHKTIRNSEWELVRMDLIGLLKHETPVAYVAHEIPRMEEVNTTPSIRLSDFEQHSIEELQVNSNQDIVLDHSSDKIHMVGALRAKDVCTRCHDVRVGDLLGAFTYQFELRRELRGFESSIKFERQCQFEADLQRVQASEEKPFTIGRLVPNSAESLIHSERESEGRGERKGANSISELPR